MSEYPFVNAKLNYVPADVETPTATYTSSAGAPTRNYSADPREMRIFNARLTIDDYSLETSGFELITSPTPLGAVRDDTDPSIPRDYYPEVERDLKARTGAKDVLIFDHTIRITGNQQGRIPVQAVHNDYTEASAPLRVSQLVGDAEAKRLFKRGRVSQVNLWRPLQMDPVTVLPLAVLDARSLGPNDLRRSDLVFPDRIGETYLVQANRRHRWRYFANMTRNEAILIKGYDSNMNAMARFTPHTAFDLPSGEEATRHSIEVRAFLFH